MMTVRFTESAWVLELDGQVVGVANSEKEARTMAEKMRTRSRTWTPSWRCGDRADGRQ